MKIVMRRTLVAGGVTLALSGIAFAANDAGVIGKAKNSVHADQVAPSTENITVNKTMFDQKDASKFAASANKIKNDGTVKDLPDGLLKYSPDTMGKIEFSLFDITKAVNAHYTDNKGLTGFSDSQSGEVTGRVQEIANAIKANETGSEYTSGSNVKKIATQAIDVNGQTTFSGVKAYDTSMPQKYHYYAIVETKTPKGFVNQKSDPIVFVAPYINPSGDGFLSNVNLYPKNNTKKLTFKLTKYQDQNAANGNTIVRSKLAGAKFQLYRGTPGGKDTIGDPITTDSNGALSVGNLVMGSYYFVELPSANVSADGSAGTGLQLSPIALNNSNNKLRFTIDENGATSEDLQGQVDNYGRPDIEKKLTNGIGATQSLHIGDLANFTTPVVFPGNLLGSAVAMGANESLTKYLPYHELNTIDTPESYLKDVASLRNLKIQTTDGKTLDLKEGTDYKLIQVGNNWGIDYITQDLSDADKAATKSTASSVDEFHKMMESKTSGHVTDKVAQLLSGKQFQYNYNEVVTGDAPMDTNIINDITLSWNDGSGHRQITKHDHTITYGVHFVKESSGFFGIGAKKLQGAQFAVQDKRTGKWFNGFKAAKDTKSGEPEAQWVDDWKDVKAGTKTSDKDGKFDLQGFTEGDYELRETKAPDGYQLMEETVGFKIGPKTDAVTISNPIVIKNNEKTSMPLTGSQQKIVVVAGAVAALVVVGAIAGYKLRIKLKG